MKKKNHKFLDKLDYTSQQFSFLSAFIQHLGQNLPATVTWNPFGSLSISEVFECFIWIVRAELSLLQGTLHNLCFLTWFYRCPVGASCLNQEGKKTYHHHQIATSPLMVILEGPRFLPVIISTRDLVMQETPEGIWTCSLDHQLGLQGTFSIPGKLGTIVIITQHIFQGGDCQSHQNRESALNPLDELLGSESENVESLLRDL